MIYRKAPLIFLVVCGFILFIFFTAEDQGPIASPLQSQKFLQLPPKLMTQGMWLNILLPWSYGLKCSVWKQGLLFVCLFLWKPSFEGSWVSLMGFSLTYGAGIDGDAPYQAQ